MNEHNAFCETARQGPVHGAMLNLVTIGHALMLLTLSSVSGLFSLMIRIVRSLACLLDLSPDVAESRCTLKITCQSATVVVVDGDIYVASSSLGAQSIAETLFVPVGSLHAGIGRGAAKIADRDKLRDGKPTGGYGHPGDVSDVSNNRGAEQ